VDLPALGYQEYTTIILSFFLLGLLRGWRRSDVARAERFRSGMRVSKGIAVLALAVFAYVSVISFLEAPGFQRLVEGAFLGVISVVFLSLLFVLPFMSGLLLWPQRRKAKDPG
jgi:hypothetical protein